MDQRGDARRQELERKKQKLAEIRRLKQQQELQQLAPVGANARAAPAQDIDVDQVLQEAGVDPGAPPLLAREPSPAVQVVAVAAAARPMSISTQNLEITQTQQIAIQTKEITSYSKTTQTDDEPRYSGCEFSEGSQEFAFDDYSIGERHEIDFDESPTREIANILPHFTLRKPGDEPIEEERSVDQRVPELSEEEKKRIALNPHFTQFIQQGTRIFERIIAEESERDVMIDYAHDAAIDDHHDNGQKLTKVREFVDKDWSEGRYVTAMDYSDSHPELIVVAYSANKDKPLDPEGVVQVWNTRFKKDTPEYTFSSPPRS
ncbi:hypothetical protein L596_022539 [Steinernema carpocapsae]|uniref:Uncharacterized protein n=1 Tax=Steinernema carpocapsae TaxID=34508 RepID=A0A4U5MLY4_STECR|nr:hypothetical protein L596_022539 [Steinernema carpocapsae]